MHKHFQLAALRRQVVPLNINAAQTANISPEGGGVTLGVTQRRESEFRNI